MAILGQLDRAGLIHRERRHRPLPRPSATRSTAGTSAAPTTEEVQRVLPRRTRRGAHHPGLLAGRIRSPSSTSTAGAGCIRAPSTRSRKDGGLAVLKGNLAAGRLHREDRRRRRVDPEVLRARPGSSSARTRRCAPSSTTIVNAGDVVVIRYEGPTRRPGHAGDALPDQLPEVERAGQGLRADHRRSLLRRHLGPVDRPRLARGGRGRHDRPGRARATSSRSTFPTARSISR